MSADDKFLIKLPPKPEVTQPESHPRDRKRAIWVAIAGAVISGGLWSAYEAHTQRKIAEKAHGPSLQIVSAVFTDQHNLRIVFRNYGPSAALQVRSVFSSLVGQLEFEKFITLGSPFKGITVVSPDQPSNGTFEVFAFVPPRHMAEKFGSAEDLSIRLLGSTEFFDSDRNRYSVPWCYDVPLPYQLRKPPGWVACGR